MRARTPSRAIHRASINPAGPAPMMSTSTSELVAVAADWGTAIVGYLNMYLLM